MNELRSLEGLGYLLHGHHRFDSQTSAGTHSRNRSYDASSMLSSPFGMGTSSFGNMSAASVVSSSQRGGSNGIGDNESSEISINSIPQFTRATSMSVHFSTSSNQSEQARARARQKQWQIMNSEKQPNFYRAISTKSVDPTSLVNSGGTSYQFPKSHNNNNITNGSKKTDSGQKQTSQLKQPSLTSQTSNESTGSQSQSSLYHVTD